MYRSGAGPHIVFKNKGEDATEEKLRLETWRADDLADYLDEKLAAEPPAVTEGEEKPKLAEPAAEEMAPEATEEKKQEKKTKKKTKKKKKKASSDNKATAAKKEL